jgi:nucleoside 2-deoxyribosyltransferase
VASSSAIPVYLAGPFGFTEAGRRFHHEVLIPAVRAAGLEPLDPWDLDPAIQAALELPADAPGRIERLVEANQAIGARNAALIEAAAGVLAVLDGADVDSGTAAEVGYAAALRRPVVGVRLDLRRTGENDATIVNLQVEWFIRTTGGDVGRDLDEAIARLAELVRPGRA